MKPGDIVWFRRTDDVEIGESYPNNDCKTKIPGKIIKFGEYNSIEVCWIARLPIKTTGSLDSLALWGIPCDSVEVMAEEEAMLVMLEN